MFPCGIVGIDSQGGGFTIAEGLRDLDKLRPGERPIYPIIEEKAKDTDDLPGDHILQLVNFAKADWTAQANHGMRKDMEDKVMLFPRFDTLSLSIMTEKDKIFFNNMKEKTGEDEALRLYDTLEDAVMEIEELKSELSTIVITVTQAGRERWDTPEIKLETGKKGRMRKDRYSALVIANMIARSERFIIPTPVYESIGRVAGPSDGHGNGRMYVGPEWTKSFDQNTCFKINKNQ